MSKAENKESMFHWLALTHNLIGCPEFEIWTDIPSKFQNVTVTESFDGVKINTGIENVNIALRGLFSDNNVLFRVGQTTTFTNLPKNYVLTFYKHNYFPYVFPIYLQNESVVGSHYIKGSKIFTGLKSIRPWTARITGNKLAIPGPMTLIRLWRNSAKTRSAGLTGLRTAPA